MSKTNEPVTKTFVKKTVEEAKIKLTGKIEETRTELTGKIENLHESLQKEINVKHNEVMNKLDSIAGSINKFDEEQTALTYRVSEHTDQLESHKKRIKKIEKTILPPPV